MNSIRVNLKKRSYYIVIGQGAIEQIGSYIHKLKLGCDAFIITNSTVKKKHGIKLENALTNSGISCKFRTVPDSETSKSIITASSVIKDLAKYDRSKRIFIIAFGGGVVGDLAGFVASVYKRGVSYIQVPTTLLAQVDSSIGGKTAVDLIEGKNLVGAIYQPRLVISDLDFIKTLDKRQLRTGLAEVIKYGVIKDAKLFNYLEKRYKDVLGRKLSALEYIVRRSSAIKAKIVGQDEREEKGLRTILNFGHTVGHAIEAATSYAGYSHGEAVAIGMIVAADLSRRLNLCSSSTCSRIENLIKNAGLPLKIKGAALRKIIDAHYMDKKFLGKRNRFVLIKKVGVTKIVEGLPLDMIKEVLLERF